VNLLNPKAAFFYVAILPSFIAADHAALTQGLVLTLAYVTLATLMHSAIVMLAGTAERFLQDDKRCLWLRRIFSLALVAIAIWLAKSTAL
jgi:threonine/homoserine/homoserine lactone efflux protein